MTATSVFRATVSLHGRSDPLLAAPAGPPPSSWGHDPPHPLDSRGLLSSHRGVGEGRSPSTQRCDERRPRESKGWGGSCPHDDGGGPAGAARSGSDLPCNETVALKTEVAVIDHRSDAVFFWTIGPKFSADGGQRVVLGVPKWRMPDAQFRVPKLHLPLGLGF